MSVFGYTFEQNHIHILDSQKTWQKAQINKIAVEKFLSRNDETNTLIFFTDHQLREFEAFVSKSVPKGMTYSKNKPLEIVYPGESRSGCDQQIMAVVTVSKTDRPEHRLYQAETVRCGVNYGRYPTITFLYGEIDRLGPGGWVKEYAVFHFSGVRYSYPSEHQPFSLNQYRALNSTNGPDRAWIEPLFSEI